MCRPPWYDRVIKALFGKYFERILMSIAGLNTRLTELSEQLSKVSAEIYGQLEDLREALEEAGQLPVEVDALLTQIEMSVDALDAIVPDPEVPVDPEVPADPEPTP